MTTRDAQFLAFTRGLVKPAPVNTAPLEAMEAEARKIWPSGAERGSLYVLHAGGDDFIYEWGNSHVSRNEAALRAAEFEREQSALFWQQNEAAE